MHILWNSCSIKGSPESLPKKLRWATRRSKLSETTEYSVNICLWAKIVFSSLKGYRATVYTLSESVSVMLQFWSLLNTEGKYSVYFCWNNTRYLSKYCLITITAYVTSNILFCFAHISQRLFYAKHFPPIYVFFPCAIPVSASMIRTSTQYVKMIIWWSQLYEIEFEVIIQETKTAHILWELLLELMENLYLAHLNLFINSHLWYILGLWKLF